MAPMLTFTTDWRRLRPGRYVAVDCDPSQASLTLSHHWTGRATPTPFRDDLASGAALRWAESAERDIYAKGAEHVYNDHFDVDGFLAAWVATDPEGALPHRRNILAAAAAGDFDEWTGEKAVKFALLGESVDDPNSSAIARQTLGLNDRARDDALYEAVLRELPELLDHPELCEPLWRNQYDDLVAQIHLFDGGRVRLEERPGVYMTCVHTPRVLKTRAVLARTRSDRLLQAIHAGDGYLYTFRYRPYLGYRIVSKPLTAVHDMDRVARDLNHHWPTEGEQWRVRGWWSKELMLLAWDGGRRRVPLTPPEVALPILEEVLEELDLRHPGAPELAEDPEHRS